MPSLYANIVSSNAVIQPNNNTSLYNPLGGNVIPVNGNINANNVNVSNSVYVGGQISSVGNITTAGYFIGDGSQLSNITSSYGNANVAAFLPTYTGNLSGAGLGLTGAAVVTGNITTGGFYFGDGSQLTGITANYSNANVAAFLPTYSGNISAGNIAVVNSITGANITASGQISATGDISTQGNLRTLGAQGNIVGANYVSGNFFVGDGSLLTNVVATSNYSNANVTSLLAAFGSNTIVTTGNISGGYFLGNGSQLTGLPATYGNANVNAHMAAFGSNTIVTTGNITGGYFIGDGSQLSNIASSYGNANVAAFLPTYTGNLAGGNLAIGNNANIGGNLSVVGTIFGTFAGNISGNLVVPGANTDVLFNNSGNAGASTNFQFDSATNILDLNGQANVTGNVTASYFLGNGSQLTGLPATYSNANVTTLLASFGSNTINTTGNITGGNIIGNGQFLTSLTGGNVTGTVANATFATSAGTATSATTADQANYANIANSVSGSNVTGSVAQANFANTANAVAGGNVSGQVANALVAGTVYTAAQPNITSVGNLTSLTVTGDSLLQGNLQVNGNVTYIASNTVTINDKFINVANNAATASAANGGGIGVGPVGAEYATWSFSDANTAWQSNIKIEAPAITTTGNVTANYFIGNGSLLTNINAGNIVGAYGNANVANFLANYGSNTVVTTGNITGSNINVSTVQATGSGGLSLKNASGTTQASMGGGGGDNFAINVSTNLNGNNAQIDISPTGTGHVHIKPTGTGAVEIAPTNTGSINNMVIGNITPAAVSATVVSASGNVTGNYIFGNGSQLTGLPATYGNSNVTTLLADFGSNSISTTGNVTASYVVGNGSLLSAITGANVTGSVAQATVANTANSVSGGNVSGQVANALVAGTVYTAAQPAITSVGTLTSLSVTGNVVPGGINTDNYRYANGTPVSFAGTYGDANVNSLLSAWGSNALSTTGNVTSGNINTSFVNFGAGKGNVDASTLFLGDTTGAYQNMVRLVNNQNIGYLQIGSGNTSGLFRVSKWLSANTAMEIDTDTNRVGINKNSPTVELDVAGAIVATGNISGNYFVGNGSALTGITTSAGGSNTQLQFNNGGVFAGNVAMTFNATTGNVTLGNVVINGNAIQVTGSFQSNANPNPGRVLFGNGIAGNYNPTINTTSSRILQVDEIFKYDDGLRTGGITATLYGNLSQGNIGAANSNSRLQAAQSELYVVSGNSLTTNTFAIRGYNAALNVGGPTANVGNAFVNAGAGGTSFITVFAGSTANTMITNLSGATYNGNVTNAVGFMTYFSGSASVTGNVYGYYMPGTTSFGGQSQGNIARGATNYYFLRTDDNLAKSRLGSLELYQNFTPNASTSGSVTISKTFGQYQNMYLTGNVTSMAFSNFVTRVQTPSGTFNNQSDVVTLVIQQGATPFTMTMPTGNAQIRYANGNSTVPSVANSTVIMTVTGTYNYNTSADNYLINISPQYT